MATLRHEVDLRLERLVPDASRPPAELHQAVRYSLLAPGKRIRPILTITTAEALGGLAEYAVDPACAIEMVHTASLIVDDLPSMDDATMRRGRLACHRAHGEDLATLASIYLLNRAYGVVAAAPGLRDPVRVSLVSLVSRMVGDEGIVAGQVRDLRHEGSSRSDPTQLERMAREKTAALFVAATEAGALVARAPALRIEAVREFASNLGLCFQVLDDLLDRHGTEQTIGKDVDQDGSRATFLTVLGHDRARQEADSYLEASMDALGTIGSDAAPLRSLALFLLNSFAAKAERF
jgi:geranylgeranyl diphosphate synthase type II